MEAYGSTEGLSIDDAKWNDKLDITCLGSVSCPDKSFSFPENGDHSSGAYQRRMTIRKQEPADVQFVKIIIRKQTDTYSLSS